MSHKKIGPDRFSRFDAYWVQTNKQTDKQTNRQTDRQAKFIYRRRDVSYPAQEVMSLILYKT